MSKRNNDAKTRDIPEIYMTHADHEALTRLVGDRTEGVAERLRQELERAIVVDDHDLPSGTIGLNQWLHYTDGRSDTARRVQIVVPSRADIDEGRISVLSNIGAGLIGLVQGHGIPWADPSGVERLLTPVLVEDRDPLA